MVDYRVRSEDTLVRIAARFNVSVKQIVDANAIADPNRIVVGQVLRIPGGEPVAAPAPAAAVQPPAAPAGLNIDRKKFRLPGHDYVAEATTKNLLVVHFTAGMSASGAVSQFRTGMAKDLATGAMRYDRIATAYVLDLSGIVYELFDPTYWAYHLKAGVPNEQRSIGIEVVNPGALMEDRGDASFLNWWPPADPGSGAALFRTRFCGKQEHDRYVEQTWRGFRFWAAFTEEQRRALPPLVKYLCAAHNIPARVSPRQRWLPAKSDRSYFDQFTGVAGHHHFRDDKFDPGPAWDWSLLGLPEVET